jgi:two-component system OmpR family sensor kinase
MFLKNSTQRLGNSIRSTRFVFVRWSAHSLRLRLMLWYGSLLILGLACFALLVLFLAANAINANTKSAISGVTRAATLDLSRSLSSLPPYWPTHLALETLDTYSAPGVIVEVFDQHGALLYTSDPTSSLTLTRLPDLRSGPFWYTTNIDGGQALVEASAIYPPPAPNSFAQETGDTRQLHLQSQSKNPIGTLLVARSLQDVNATLASLQILLLLTGMLILALFLLCGWAVIGYALRPLADLVRTASSIATATAHGKRLNELSSRVKRPKAEDEMAQVVDAFNEMLTSIESSTAVQRRFIADASHELRAPLTTIQGNLAFLLRYIEELPPAERHTMLADAHRETLRLASLVDELLILARADAGMGRSLQPAQPAPVVELDRTLLKLVRQMRQRLEIEGVAVKIEIGVIEPVRVRGDEESLRRIMVILLDNAIKYTRPEEGRGEGKITVALQRSDNEAVLRVSDTGIGIEAKDLPHIFERFYRADLARSREGTGLGLAIAQTLVEQLNGHITASSTPGAGSTFRVSLPLA